VTQLVFGGRVDRPMRSTGTFTSPICRCWERCFGANLRTGRFVEMLRSASQVVLYQKSAASEDLTSAMAGRTGAQMVYDSRVELGAAAWLKTAASSSVCRR